jgi:hypothetical protein
MHFMSMNNPADKMRKIQSITIDYLGHNFNLFFNQEEY